MRAGSGGWGRPPCCADGPRGKGRFENREAPEEECGNFPLGGFHEVSTLMDDVAPDCFCPALSPERVVSRAACTGWLLRPREVYESCVLNSLSSPPRGLVSISAWQIPLILTDVLLGSCPGTHFLPATP